MATDESTSCTPYLKALADETRWSIVQTLLEQPQTVSQLVEGLGITQYNVSKHLRVLREAGIVAAHRSGRTVSVEMLTTLRLHFS